MIFQYMGTAASEGIPAMFCQCRLCRTAAKNGGKDIRARSGGIINGKVMIDYSPDIYFHKIRFNLDLGNVEALFFTHSHSDHCAMRQLEFRKLGALCILEENRPPLKVFGNEAVGKMFEEEGFNNAGDSLEFTEMKLYQRYEAGNVAVTPMRATHDLSQTCMIFLIEHKGKRMIYGNDTGYFKDDVFDFLEGKRLDYVSLDCTSGLGKEGNNHMGLVDCVSIKNELIKRNSADNSTTFVITHFAHGGVDVIHEKLERGASKENFLVAYDGMTVNI